MLGLWSFNSNDTASCDESSEAGVDSPILDTSLKNIILTKSLASSPRDISDQSLASSPRDISDDQTQIQPILDEKPQLASSEDFNYHNDTTNSDDHNDTTNSDDQGLEVPEFILEEEPSNSSQPEKSDDKASTSDVDLDLYYDPPSNIAPFLMGPPADADLRRQYLVGIRDVYEVVVDGPTLRFLQGVPDIFSEVPRHKTPLLPPLEEGGKPTLVLDMDETMIYALLYLVDENAEIDPEVLDLGWDFFFAIPSLSVIANVKKRPGLDTFLEDMAKLFEIVVWTAGEKNYADAILDQLDPNKTLISHRLYRRHCTRILDFDGNGGVFMKDLSSLGRSITRTCILENSPRNFGFQIDNGLAIKSYEKDASIEDAHVFPEDDALKKVSHLLERLASFGDNFDEHISTWFRMGEIARALPPLI